MTWVPAYGRWYCEACRQYMPGGGHRDKASDELNEIFGTIEDELGGRPTYKCQVCQTRLDFVHAHGRWHCSRCQSYL